MTTADVGVDPDEAEVGVVDLGDDRSVAQSGQTVEVVDGRTDQRERVAAGRCEGGCRERGHRAFAMAPGDTEGPAGPQDPRQEVGAVPASPRRVRGDDLGFGGRCDGRGDQGRAGLHVVRRVRPQGRQPFPGEVCVEVGAPRAVAARHLCPEVLRDHGERCHAGPGDAVQMKPLAGERTGAAHARRMAEPRLRSHRASVQGWSGTMPR